MWFYLETEGHDFTGQTVASEESLHGVSQLYLLGEHIPQQLIQQVARVKQCHQHTGQLVLKKTHYVSTTTASNSHTCTGVAKPFPGELQDMQVFAPALH